MHSLNNLIRKLVDLILSSKYIIALTGAGISTESGIPDFRGPNGLWRRIDPEVASYSYFIKHPEDFWRFYIDFIKIFQDIKPNSAHYGLAKIEKLGMLKAIITQNIDGLHQKAGSKNVIELHGDLKTISCISCGMKYLFKDIIDIINEKGLPPRCVSCGGILKPDIIFFGEPLPQDAVEKAFSEAYKSDLILVLGTSLSVYPAAYIPDIVKSSGGKVIIINYSKTMKDYIGDIVIRGKLGEIIPKIVDEIEELI